MPKFAHWILGDYFSEGKPQDPGLFRCQKYTLYRHCLHCNEVPDRREKRALYTPPFALKESQFVD